MPEPTAKTPNPGAPANRPAAGAPARTRKPKGSDERREAMLASATKVLTGLIVVVLLGSWIFSRGALERYIASTYKEAPKVVIHWPLVNGSKAISTYVPEAVQADLAQVAGLNLNANPFDRAALEQAADRLKATGWFARGLQVSRRPGGVVQVDGVWRVPAAVVHKDGRNHLVATDGSVLRLPVGAEPPEGMFQISNPTSPAPLADNGEPAYGTPWLGNDVQSAISLLRTLCQRPVARQISGVDLSDFLKNGKLTLITDKGTRIVWGSAIGDSVPGEVKVERKIARLEQNLKEFGRIDANQNRVEIYTPIVLVDKTAKAESGS